MFNKISNKNLAIKFACDFLNQNDYIIIIYLLHKILFFTLENKKSKMIIKILKKQLKLFFKKRVFINLML